MSGATPTITIIVPTYNRPDSLRRCLGYLAAQTTQIPTEIVVVDDGSDDGERVAKVVAHTPHARLVRQRRRGPAAARNAGVRAARGSVICFTDDDCEPRAEWSARLADAVLAGADVVAGATTNGRVENRFAWASQLQAEYFTRHSGVPFAASNNIGATAVLMREVPFDDRYQGASEDRDWCDRVAQLGYRIVYEPSAVVHHQQRLTFWSYIRQHAGYGRGSHRYHRGGTRRRSLERPRFYVGLFGHGFRHGLAIGLLVTLGQAATTFGYLREWVGGLSSRGRTVVG
jgi:glycosyltransferase involved in cell wall biosynthesis